MINSIETLGLNVECMTPSPYSTNVDVNADIEVSFNSELDTDTIFGNIYVLKDKNRQIFGKPTSINVKDFEPVKGSLTYRDRVVNFKPIGQLEKSTRYIVYIPKGSIRDFKGREGLTNYISFFDTDGFSTLPPCSVALPANNSVIDKLTSIKLEDIGSERYIIQISKNKDFENGVYDEVVDTISITEGLSNIGDGSYYIRAKATNGIFGETSFFTVKTIPETLVSDDDESYIYQPIEEDDGIQLVDSFPNGVNVHEKTNLMYIKLDGIVPIENIDFYESGVFKKELTGEDEFDSDPIDGTYSIIHDELNNLTYVAFIPDNI